MKLKALAAGFALAAGLSTAAQAVELETQEQKLSYSLGAMLGERLKGDFESIDMQALTAGLNDSLDAKPHALSQEDMMAAIQNAQQQAQQKAQVAQQADADANSAKTKAFMAENAQKDGVITTESGLQYKVVKAGEGDKPAESSRVTVHYEGRTLDGEIFDSSMARGEPAQFGVNQVIPGWTEALQLMNKGSSWEVYIPAELAYGPSGIPGKIGPNAMLIFKVELIDFE